MLPPRRSRRRSHVRRLFSVGSGARGAAPPRKERAATRAYRDFGRLVRIVRHVGRRALVHPSTVIRLVDKERAGPIRRCAFIFATRSSRIPATFLNKDCNQEERTITVVPWGASLMR